MAPKAVYSAMRWRTTSAWESTVGVLAGVVDVHRSYEDVEQDAVGDPVADALERGGWQRRGGVALHAVHGSVPGALLEVTEDGGIGPPLVVDVGGQRGGQPGGLCGVQPGGQRGVMSETPGVPLKTPWRFTAVPGRRRGGGGEDADSDAAITGGAGEFSVVPRRQAGLRSARPWKERSVRIA